MSLAVVAHPLSKEQSIQSLPVKTDHHLTVNHRYRRSEHAQLPQFRQGGLILGHIALYKSHSFL